MNSCLSLSQASDKHPVSTAANECIARLSELLGPSIFHARVESYNPRYKACMLLSIDMLMDDGWMCSMDGMVAVTDVVCLAALG